METDKNVRDLVKSTKRSGVFRVRESRAESLLKDLVALVYYCAAPVDSTRARVDAVVTE